MQRSFICNKGTFAILIFTIAAGALMGMPVRLTAQATPTPEFSNNPAAPPEDATVVSACDLPKNSGDGFVIISATLPPRERRIGFPLVWRYEYKPQNAGWLHQSKSIDIGYYRHAKSDFNEVFGELYVLRLSAGTYEFREWEYHPYALRGTERPFGIHPLTFNVERGRAVYLGGLDPTIIEGRNLFHQKVDEAWVLVHDDQARDLPVFFNKCPGFDRNLLDVKVMDTTPWRPPEKK